MLDPLTRDKYLRKEASWRQIPLISQSGHLTHWLQYIRHYREWDDITELSGGHIGFQIWDLRYQDGPEPHFYFPKGLDLGLYWDLLLESGAQALSGGWKMCWDTRVGDVEIWKKFCEDLHFSHDLRGPTDDEIAELFTIDRAYSLLRFYGEQCNGTENGSEEDLWLEMIGKDGKFEVNWNWAFPRPGEEAKWGSKEFPLPPRSLWPRFCRSQ